MMCTITFFRKKGFYLLFPYRSQGCVEGQNICMHGVICFILIKFIMQHDYFQKRNQINLLTPPQRSRISVRAKHLLICYCKLPSFNLICNMTIILKKLILYGGGRHNMIGRGSTRWCYISKALWF